MARIESIALRLNNWALWRLRDMGGGLGYATQSVLLSEPVDRYREVNINETIDGTDAGITNTAVESLKPGQPHLYAVVQCYYIGKGENSPRATARYLGKSESTVYANLDQADVHIRTWLNGRMERLQKESNRTFTP